MLHSTLAQVFLCLFQKVMIIFHVYFKYHFWEIHYKPWAAKRLRMFVNVCKSSIGTITCFYFILFILISRWLPSVPTYRIFSNSNLIWINLILNNTIMNNLVYNFDCVLSFVCVWPEEIVTSDERGVRLRRRSPSASIKRSTRLTIQENT